MDPQQFGALSRVLASGAPRGLVLAGLITSFVARFPVAHGGEETQAKYKKKKT